MRRLAWPAAILGTIVLSVYVGLLIMDSYDPRPFIIRRPDGPVQLLTGDMPVARSFAGCIQGEFGTTTLLLDDVYGTAIEVRYGTRDGPTVFRGPLAWPVGYTALRTGDVVEVFADDRMPVAMTGDDFYYQGYLTGPNPRPGHWVGSRLPATGAFWMCADFDPLGPA